MDNVHFPSDIKLHDDKKKDGELRNATNLIRLITRVIFIWFIKEKKLVPANLFRKEFLDKTKKWEPVELNEWRGLTEVEPLSAFVEFDENHWLVKEEILPDGRKKVILKEKDSGKIIQKEV